MGWINGNRDCDHSSRPLSSDLQAKHVGGIWECDDCHGKFVVTSLRRTGGAITFYKWEWM